MEANLAGTPQEVKELVEQDNRARRIVVAALNNQNLMDQVLKAYQQRAAGTKGEAWAEVQHG
jgi:hypothetical protein